MDNRLRKVLMILFGSVFIISSTLVVKHYIDDRTSESIYEESIQEFVVAQAPPPRDIEPPLPGSIPVLPEEDAQVTVEDPAAEPEPQIKPEQTPPNNAGPKPKPLPEPGIRVDFTKLQKTNEDIFGWIYIPNSTIHFPLLLGVDNNKYLNMTYNGKQSRFGSIFLDMHNSSDMSDTHSIIYGHNLRNATMFSGLLSYKKQSFFEGHPYIYILTEQGYIKYEVFSAYTTTTDSGAYTRKFSTADAFDVFLTQCQELSNIRARTAPVPDSRIITLSTCTSPNQKEERFVVHAMLIDDKRETIIQE